MTTETKKATTEAKKAMKAKEAKMIELNDKRDAQQGTRLGKRFNKTYLALEKTEMKLFAIVEEVVASDSVTQLKAFKATVSCDRSIVNKYIKVARDEFIKQYGTQLPSAISVRIKIAQSGRDTMESMLKSGELSSSTTLKELIAGIDQRKAKESDTKVDSGWKESGVTSVIKFANEFTEQEIDKVRAALETLDITIAKEIISMLPKASNDVERGICPEELTGVAA